MLYDKKVIENIGKNIEYTLNNEIVKIITLFIVFSSFSEIVFIDTNRVFKIIKYLYLMGLTTLILIDYSYQYFNRYRQFKFNINIIFLSFSFLAFLSIYWSMNPYLTLKNAFLLFVTTVISIFIAKYYSKYEFMNYSYLWFAIIIIINSILFIFNIGDIYQYGELRYSIALKGIFPQKNTLGLFMSISIFFSLYKIINCKIRDTKQVSYILVLLLSYILLYYSRSMIFLVYSLCLIPLILLLRNKKINNIIIISILPLILLILYVIMIQPTWYVYIIESLNRDITLTGRTDIWKGVLKAVNNKPILGYGYSSFWSPTAATFYFIIPAFYGMMPHAHNGLIDIAIDFGILGILLFIALLVLTYIRLYKFNKNVIDNNNNYYFLGFANGYTIFLLIYTILESPIIRHSNLTYVLLIVFINFIFNLSSKNMYNDKNNFFRIELHKRKSISMLIISLIIVFIPIISKLEKINNIKTMSNVEMIKNSFEDSERYSKELDYWDTNYAVGNINVIKSEFNKGYELVEKANKTNNYNDIKEAEIYIKNLPSRRSWFAEILYGQLKR